MRRRARSRGHPARQRRVRKALLPRPVQLQRAQRLAMGAVSADLGTRQQDLKSEVAFDLLAQPLQGFAEKFLHLAATQTDDVRVLLLQASLIIMPVSYTHLDVYKRQRRNSAGRSC